MVTAYTICAVIGITIFVVQLILMFFGMHGEGDFDMDHDVGFGGGDLPHDFGGMGDVDADLSGVDLAHDGHIHIMEDTQVINEGATSFFNVLSFRSIVAAVAFFGAGGRLADDLGWHPVLCFVFALGMGAVALLLVGWMMVMLASLRHDGTVRIGRAIGLPASVYLGIPEHRTGMGRVTFTLQERTVEYNAVTDGDAIPTGGQVVVVDIVDDTTLAVKREGGNVEN